MQDPARSVHHACAIWGSRGTFRRDMGFVGKVVAALRAHWLPLTLVCLCALTVLPIAVRPGWPLNHDRLALFERVEIFRREFAAGHVFPLWTPFCSNGHGSPVPFIYHRLFNSVAGVLALVFGTVRGTALAIVVSLSVGALGMSACARALGLPPWLRLWAGALLPIAHYTFVNWLVRGSAAELTAGMLGTWLLYVCLRMQAGHPFGLRLGVVLVLIFYAHVVIFVYAMILIAIATLFTLRFEPGELAESAQHLAKGVGIALAIVLAFAGPYAAALVLIGREFSLHRLSDFVPQEHFSPIAHYLVDPYAWGETYDGISVEIGRFLVLGLALASILNLTTRDWFRDRAFLTLASALATYFALQTPLAAAFYEAIPATQIIQFPWRLMVFITPLCILLLARLANGLIERGGVHARMALAIVAGVFVAQVAFTTRPYRATYVWYKPAVLEYVLDALNGPYAAGEFVPIGLPNEQPPPSAPFLRLDGCTLVSSSVDLDRLRKVPFGTVDLTFTSERGCTVHLSQFRTLLLIVEASAGGEVTRTRYGTTDVTLPPGRSTVHIARRGLFDALARAITARDDT